MLWPAPRGTSLRSKSSPLRLRGTSDPCRPRPFATWLTRTLCMASANVLGHARLVSPRSYTPWSPCQSESRSPSQKRFPRHGRLWMGRVQHPRPKVCLDFLEDLTASSPGCVCYLRYHTTHRLASDHCSPHSCLFSTSHRHLQGFLNNRTQAYMDPLVNVQGLVST